MNQKITFLKPIIFLVLVCLSMSSCKSSKFSINLPKPRDIVKIKLPKPDIVIITNDDNKESTGNSGSTSTPKSTSASNKADKIIKTAEQYLGTPHVMGGMSKKGIDCSGLMVVSYKAVNVNLPRVSRDQAKTGKPVKMTSLQKGDLVFFTYPGGNRITHVGLVTEVKSKSEVLFIHTSSSRGVTVDNLYSSYWKKNFMKATRPL